MAGDPDRSNMAELFRKLVEDLNATGYGGGSLLDITTVVMSSEFDRMSNLSINVEINLAVRTDAAVAQHYAGELAKATDGASERVDRVIATGRSRFPRSLSAVDSFS